MTPEQLSTFYTETISNKTLSEALEEHYKINPQFTRYDEFQTKECGVVIKSHDISHLIYGCDTSYFGEYKVQMWNNFGSSKTMPKLSFKLIFSKDLRSLIQLVLPAGLIKFANEHKPQMNALKSEIKSKAISMKQKWIYGDEYKYMDQTITQIRTQYGIDILK